MGATETCRTPGHPPYGHHHHPAGGSFKHRHPGCPNDCGVVAFYPENVTQLTTETSNVPTSVRPKHARIPTLDEIAERIHANAAAHGFWPHEGRNFGEMMPLVHSEVSEALEEFRVHGYDDPIYVPVHKQGCDHSGDGLTEPKRDDCGHPDCKPEGVAVELVDAIIRLLDTLHHVRQIDGGSFSIDELVERKMTYNEGRPFKHGKAF